ncbi:hypothetical protein GGD38_006551 [Chitinophagaceae bacterium OAS944]|nr:hypothetical protein [Chitinophagaceae bacterium OAS944]
MIHKWLRTALSLRRALTPHIVDLTLFSRNTITLITTAAIVFAKW